MEFISESMSIALMQTKKVLFEKFDFKKYFLFGILYQFLSGQFSLNWMPDLQIESNNLNPSGDLWSSVLSSVGPYLICSIFFIILFILGAIITYFIYFMFIDSILKNKMDLAESWKNNFSKGIAYFLWSIAIFLAAIAAIGLIVVSLLALSKSMQTNSLFAMGGGCLGLIAVTIILWLFIVYVVTVIFSLLPTMLKMPERTSVFSAYNLLKPQIKTKEFQKNIRWLVLSLILIGGILSTFASLIVIMPINIIKTTFLASQTPLGISLITFISGFIQSSLLALIYAPIGVYIYSYSLAFSSLLFPQYQTLYAIKDHNNSIIGVKTMYEEVEGVI